MKVVCAEVSMEKNENVVEIIYFWGKVLHKKSDRFEIASRREMSSNGKFEANGYISLYFL